MDNLKMDDLGQEAVVTDIKTINKEKFEKMADVMKAVAHPLRLKIVALLCKNDQRVNDIAETLDTKQALISQQLRILRMSGLVEVTRKDGIGKYTLAEPRLKDLIACVSGCGKKD